MLLKDLPIEIFIKILDFLSLNDFIKIYRTSKKLNNYICIYIKCNICKYKINEYMDIFIFKKCYKCKEIICKKCQSCCNYENCDNFYCEHCLITEIC